MMRRKGKYFTFLIAALTFLIALSNAFGQSWLDFVHPNDPHLAMPNPDVPITTPALVQGPGDVIVQQPLLVILMEFSDITHRAVHTDAFWEDLAFGNPRNGVRPSLSTIYRENSNGRLLLVPATAGDIYDGSSDGVVGWVASPQTAAQLGDVHLKRAAGMQMADPLFDYNVYDTNSDGLITTDELLVLVVLADNAATGASCDQHHPSLNHPDPPTCIGTPGGNTRTTTPSQVIVDQNTSDPVSVFQHIAGVGEHARVGVVVHEIGHSNLGLGDLYPINWQSACKTWQQVTDGFICDGVWYPVRAGVYTLMDNYTPSNGFVHHLDPWAKIHHGFVKPLIVTHDGIYQVYRAETDRSFSTQNAQPEAIIIYDPLRTDPYREYFILENRSITGAPANNMDDGLAVWLINEQSLNWPHGLNLRKVVRLIRRGGHFAGDVDALWDGVDQNQGYDLTSKSTPRNTNWTDGTPSYIEVKEISPAAEVMTVHITIPPLFVDASHLGASTGAQIAPYNTVGEAVTGIPAPPRTIRIAGGTYSETMTLSKPCTLKGWRNGNAIIGK